MLLKVKYVISLGIHILDLGSAHGEATMEGEAVQPPSLPCTHIWEERAGCRKRDNILTTIFFNLF